MRQSTIYIRQVVTIQGNIEDVFEIFPDPRADNFFQADNFVGMNYEQILLICNATAVCLAHHTSRVYVCNGQTNQNTNGFTGIKMLCCNKVQTYLI